MAREYYFAYGSNMDEEQMRYRCPNAIKVSEGLLPVYRFAIDQAGVATVIWDPSSFVEGIVWSVTPNDIRNLDRYEGVAENWYRKDYLSVVKRNRYGTFIEALVYISCRPEWDKPSGTGSRYMRDILHTAAHHHFREDYMQILMKYAEIDNIPAKPRKSVVETV